MALRKIAHENAIYIVFEGKHIREGYKPKDQLCVDGSYYTFGDVFSSALNYGDCPLEALKRAEGFNHDIYWLSQNPITLSASRAEDKERAFSVSVGDKVKYAGKIFTVKKAPNNNLVLIADTQKGEQT
tara:strand:- start:223 stop:606 length:384 start_codon:yes stop_codon:yes gene_type:complete